MPFTFSHIRILIYCHSYGSYNFYFYHLHAKGPRTFFVFRCHFSFIGIIIFLKNFYFNLKHVDNKFTHFILNRTLVDRRQRWISSNVDNVEFERRRDVIKSKRRERGRQRRGWRLRVDGRGEDLQGWGRTGLLGKLSGRTFGGKIKPHQRVRTGDIWQTLIETKN